MLIPKHENYDCTLPKAPINA